MLAASSKLIDAQKGKACPRPCAKDATLKELERGYDVGLATISRLRT